MRQKNEWDPVTIMFSGGFAGFMYSTTFAFFQGLAKMNSVNGIPRSHLGLLSTVQSISELMQTRASSKNSVLLKIMCRTSMTSGIKVCR